MDKLDHLRLRPTLLKHAAEHVILLFASKFVDIYRQKVNKKRVEQDFCYGYKETKVQVEICIQSLAKVNNFFHSDKAFNALRCTI